MSKSAIEGLIQNKLPHKETALSEPDMEEILPFKNNNRRTHSDGNSVAQLIEKPTTKETAINPALARPSKAAAQTQGVTVDDDLFAELSRVAPTANVSPDTAKIVSTSPAASQDKAQGKG